MLLVYLPTKLEDFGQGQLLGFIFHHGAIMGYGHGHGLDDPLRNVRVWGGSLGIFCLEKHHNLLLTSPIHNEKIIRFNRGSTSFWLVETPISLFSH
jgi:hypothetical protein